MRKRWRHNARQSGEGGLIDELLRNVMATQHLKVKLAAHHVHNIVHRAILGSVAMFMLNNITLKSSMANYNIPVRENPITDSIEITHEPAGTTESKTSEAGLRCMTVMGHSRRFHDVRVTSAHPPKAAG